jgi:tyrosyl-DNA phosphodiesterase-1
MALGSGKCFKRDLLSYLEAYGPKKTGPLVQQLRKYDFAAIRAALVASVPSKQLLDDLNSDKQTLWGWPALKDTLRRVPRKERPASESHKPRPNIVTQVGWPFVICMPRENYQALLKKIFRRFPP